MVSELYVDKAAIETRMLITCETLLGMQDNQNTVPALKRKKVS